MYSPRMATEIERKFLVNLRRLPHDLAHNGGDIIEQGYLTNKPAVRVRVAERRAWLTIKGPGKISRAEYEYPIPVKDGRELLSLCKSRLVKIRRKVKIGRHTWEVDQFLESLRGLWTAEVELGSEDEAIVIPKWVGKEVSLDSRYSNSRLAKSQRIPRIVSV